MLCHVVLVRLVLCFVAHIWSCSVCVRALLGGRTESCEGYGSGFMVQGVGFKALGCQALGLRVEVGRLRLLLDGLASPRGLACLRGFGLF